MKTIILCFLCAQFFSLRSSYGIEVPGVKADKKTLTSLGIKTLGWQKGEQAQPHVSVHHNYSKVSVQTAQNSDQGQTQIADLDDNFLEQVQTPSAYEVAETNNPEKKLILGQRNLNTENVINRNISKTSEESQNILQLSDVMDADNQLKLKQTDNYLSFNQNNEKTTNDQNDERQPKRFYTLDKPIYVHGFKYPPDSYDYPKNDPNPKSESYTECPSSATGQFVYSYSCNQFLNCWKGRGVVTNCAPGTLFNPKTLECDYASKVTCLAAPNSGGGLVTGNENVQMNCPPNFSGILPHHDDCSKYIVCVNGVENVLVCAPGTLFSLKSNGCDYPYNAECSDWNYNGVSETGNGQLHETEWKQTQGPNFGQKPEHNLGTNPGTILGQNQETNWNQKPGTILGHNQNQGSYLRQVPETTSGQNANQGTILGQPNVYSASVKGFSQEQLDKTGRTGNVQSRQIGQGGSTPKNYDTQQESSYINIPDKSTSITCPNGASGVHPHPYDCSKFLNCANGQTAIQDCGPGTLFNPKYNVCDFPYNVDCDETHGENIIDPRMPPSGLLNSNTQQLRDVQTKSVSCPKGASGVYPHPYDCSKFLNCANGQTFVQDCGPGTVFNPNIKVCDFPYNVDCNSNHGENIIQVRDYKLPPPTTTNQNLNQNRKNDTVGLLIKQVYGDNPNTGHGQSGHNQNSVLNQQEVDYGDISPFPSTDVNADYEFGDSNVDEKVIPGKVLPKNPTPTSKNACDTFNFYCKLDECVPQGMVCDGNKDCSNGLDEQHCEKYVQQFTPIPNSILAVREKEKLLNITVIDCAKICLESKGFQCKSFSYRKDDGACLLTDSNVGNCGALIKSKPYDYYELTSSTIDCANLHVCPNRKCVDKKQICDGVNDCGDRSDEKNCSAESLGYEIKLSGAINKHEGRVEIKAFGKWGYICDDRFGLRNADVVCKELGFPLGSLEVKANSFYAKDLNDRDVLYLMDDVTCLGNETSIRDCDFNGWGVHNCEPQEVVGIVCKTPQETCPKDHWKCDSVQECVPLAFVCDDVFDCTDQSDEGTHHCETPTEMRLVSGKSKFEGRVEVRHHGIWGTICDDDFNDDAAKVVCKGLGFFGKATAKKEGFFGPGSGPIWLDQVFCQGNESSLEECVHWNWGEHNCEHAEDIGVVCDNSNLVPANEPNIEIMARHQIPDVLPERLFPERCGYRNDDQFLEDDGVHFRVIKGSIAKKGDYPWQASLRIKNKSKSTHWCGAVVIAKKFVLTAAHCLVGFSKGAYIVIAGDYNTDESEGTEQDAYIEEFYIHEKFRSGQKMNNDIALVKLKGDGFIFTKDIQPICLPESNKDYDRNKNCTISGFGSIQSGISGYSHDLRAGWINLQPKAVCQMPHVYGQAITDGMMCAGSLDEGVDACDGDSGGPLACLENGLFTLYGITSWGQHCGHANKPGVYVKISFYRDWIDETMKRHL